MLKPFDLVGGSYYERSTIIDVQRTINYYVNIDKKGKKNPQLVGVPGIKTKPILELVPGDIPTRAQFAYGQFQYIIAGDTFYRMDSAEISTAVDTIGTTEGYVSMACNGTQVILVDGQAGYIYTIATQTLTLISSSNFPSNPTQVTYMSGRFAVSKGQSNVWYISGLGNGLTWNEGNLALKNAQDDLLAGIGNVHNRILLFGTNSIEFWVDEGDAVFPFRRDNNILPQFGTSALASIAEGGIGNGQTALFFLAGDTNGVGSVMMTTGGNPVPISTQAMDNEFQTYSTVADATGYVYKQDGHYFYMLFFPTADKCWCYDATVADPYLAWHEREMLDSSRFIGQTHAYFNNKHYVGDYRKAVLYVMSKDFYMFDTETIRSTRITRYVTDGTKRSRIREFCVDFQHGVGNLKNPGAEPFAYLSVSTDDGVTFGSLRRAIIGRMGQRNVRTRWLQLGTSRSWVFKIITYAPVPKTAVGASIDIVELTN